MVFEAVRFCLPLIILNYPVVLSGMMDEPGNFVKSIPHDSRLGMHFATKVYLISLGLFPWWVVDDGQVFSCMVTEL